MSLENKAHDLLSSFPVAKKVAKRVYQASNVAIFRPKKSDGKIERITPKDEYEYLFGYYDKSPWDRTNRYILCLRVKNASKNVAPKEDAEIILIDTTNNNSIKVLGKTKTWNVQQGCMLGWLGPNFDKEIFYNDCRDKKYVGIIKNIETGDERFFERPFYSVSEDGKNALSLDFSRLHRLRPGYGYSNLVDKTKGKKVPEGACVWSVDLKTGKIVSVLTYKRLYDFEHRENMEGAEHKVNHLMFSPNGKRFMVIHRWLDGGKKYSRLLTCNIDGGELFNLSDDDMVSHCCWKNNQEILAFCQKEKKKGYFLLKDKNPEYEQKWDWLTVDGHPSYSPDGSLVITDTYPNKKRISTLRILSETAGVVIAKVYSPFKYDNDTRCDLHPRWSRDGKKVCFDGCMDNKRELYVVDVPKYTNKDTRFSIITPVYNAGSLIKPLIVSLNKQTYKNFELILVDDNSREELAIETKEILKEADFNYKYIKNERNIGAGESRNRGIVESKGDYLLFVDADDYVSAELLAKIQKVLCGGDFDVVLFNLERINNKKQKRIKTLCGCRSGVVEKDKVLLYSSNCVAGKCIKREIILENGIKFPNIVRYEDWVFNCRCFSNSKSFYYDDESLYFYVDNPNSVVNKNTGVDLVCANKAFNEIKKLKIPDDIKTILHMREIDYLFIKKRILRKPISEKTFFVDSESINRGYIKRRNFKLNKYIVMKLLSIRIIRRVIIRDGK